MCEYPSIIQCDMYGYLHIKVKRQKFVSDGVSMEKHVKLRMAGRKRTVEGGGVGR